MPHEYKTADAFVRPRRIKDKDARSTASSSSGRRQRESSRSSNRSPPQTSRPAAASSIYNQQNTTSDQLPPLPESGTVSPSSAKSPVLRARSCTHGSTDSLTSAALIHTPAALQPYLEYDDDDDEPSSNTIRRVTSADERSGASPALSFALPEPPQKFYDSHTATPLAVESRPDRGQSHPRSASPGFFSPPSESDTTDPPKASSPKLIQNAPYQPPSPPTSSVSPFWGPPISAPGPFAIQPYSQALVYVGNQPAVAPQFPPQGGLPSEHYFAAPYGGHPHIPIPQSGDPPVEFQSYCPPHASPQQAHATLQALRSPPIRYGSPSSSMSMSGELYPGMVPPSSHPMVPPSSHPMEPAAKSAGGGPQSQSPEDDAVDLLQRIQSAIPDLHTLVNKYRETSGRLGERESRIKESEAQKAAVLKQKEAYIQQLVKETEAISTKYSAESSKLRLEIGNMEEKQKSLQDSWAAEKKSRGELEAAYRNLQAKLEQSERAIQEKEAMMNRNVELWKRKMSEDFGMKQRSLEDELRRTRDSEAALQAQLGQVHKAHTQEKEGLSRQRRELETNNTKLRRNLDDALEAKKRDLEESHKKQQLNKEAWDKERTVLGKGTEEQRKVLVAQHQIERDELEKTYRQSEARIRKQAEESITKLQDETEELRVGWDSDKIRFNKATAELRAAANKLNEENVKLQKLADAFGNITELKSKGDHFYHESFNSLQNQISDLARRYFREGPTQLPREVLENIPANLPSMIMKTDSSRQLRVAYIEHIISSVIVHQIFDPFLFTLAMRRKSMDELLREWAEGLREQSKKRETIFRQQILHAAYTSPSAKQSINQVAAIVVDNIVEDIKHFAAEANWEHIRVGIRRIVKLAIETWRYTRLEKGVITASLSHENGSASLRLEETGNNMVSAEPAAHQSRELLLLLFPLVQRQPVPEELRGDAKEDTDGCVYTPGRILYADDPVVFAGLEEHGPALENVSNAEILDGTDLAHQAETPIPNTEAQESEKKPPKNSEQLAISPMLSTVQPPVIPNDYDLSSSGKSNGAARSALPTPVEDFAAIQSHFRSQTPPLVRRSTGTTNPSDNGSFSDGASTPTTVPAGLPDWGDANGAVPGSSQGGW